MEKILAAANASRRIRGLLELRELPWRDATHADPKTCLLALAFAAEAAVPVIGGGGWLEFPYAGDAEAVALALRTARQFFTVRLPGDINDLGLGFDLGWVRLRKAATPIQPTLFDPLNI